MKVTLGYREELGGFVVSMIWNAWERPRAGRLLEPVNSSVIPDTVRILEENLPQAIAILRFNGIEVEVEK